MSELWAIDPGKHCGLSVFDWVSGTHLKSIKLEDYVLLNMLTQEANIGRIECIVIEDFISRGGITRGSRNEASQIIGAVKLSARGNSISVIRQEPGVRTTAAKWAGVRVPKGHMPDEMSSYLHGVYYLRKQGKFKTVLERKMKSNGN